MGSLFGRIGAWIGETWGVVAHIYIYIFADRRGLFLYIIVWEALGKLHPQAAANEGGGEAAAEHVDGDHEDRTLASKSPVCSPV